MNEPLPRGSYHDAHRIPARCPSSPARLLPPHATARPGALPAPPPGAGTARPAEGFAASQGDCAAKGASPLERRPFKSFRELPLYLKKRERTKAACGRGGSGGRPCARSRTKDIPPGHEHLPGACQELGGGERQGSPRRAPQRQPRPPAPLPTTARSRRSPRPRDSGSRRGM